MGWSFQKCVCIICGIWQAVLDLVHRKVMNDEMTGKCLRQVEHIHGHLCHRYSVIVNQVRVATVPFVHFLLAIVLSVLRYTDSDYPFGIFKLFFNSKIGINEHIFTLR
jgi:hypothetical protein